MSVIVDCENAQEPISQNKINDTSITNEQIKPFDIWDNTTGNNYNMNTIYITGGGYYKYPFTNASDESKLSWEEPVWGADLTRSVNLVLQNVCEVAYGLVARVEVNFRYMNVADYKALCKIAKERVCRVTYYNYEKCQWVYQQEFAFTSQEKSKLYAFGEKYIGVSDVSITLVATNRDLENDVIQKEYTVSYSTVAEPQTAGWGDAVTIKGDNDSAFKCWSTDPNYTTSMGNTGTVYLPNEVVTIWGDLHLYKITQ